MFTLFWISIELHYMKRKLKKWTGQIHRTICATTDPYGPKKSVLTGTNKWFRGLHDFPLRLHGQRKHSQTIYHASPQTPWLWIKKMTVHTSEIHVAKISPIQGLMGAVCTVDVALRNCSPYIWTQSNSAYAILVHKSGVVGFFRSETLLVFVSSALGKADSAFSRNLIEKTIKMFWFSSRMTSPTRSGDFFSYLVSLFGGWDGKVKEMLDRVGESSGWGDFFTSLVS